MSPLHELYRRLHEGELGAADEIAAHAAAMGAAVVVVSACLLGEKTRYDGGDKLVPGVVAELEGAIVVPVCPEILGGMGCPRPAVHFDRGDGDAPDARVVDDQGRDHTAALVRGAELADEIARRAGAARAVLKERSPSCGSKAVHGPSGLTAGRGAFAARLVRRGLPVVSEEDMVKR